MEKVNLSTKTKIAAWWMIGIGGALLIPELIYDVDLFVIPGALLFIAAGYFLLRRKKIGWWLAVVTLVVNLVIPLPLVFHPSPISFAIPGELAFVISIFIILSPLFLFGETFFGTFYPYLFVLTRFLFFFFLLLTLQISPLL